MTLPPTRRRHLTLERLSPRYLFAVDLDPAFGELGVLADRLPSPVNPTDLAHSMTVDQQGRVLLVSSNESYETTRNTLSVIRMFPDGQLDTSFDADGLAIVSLPNGREEARDIALQADGKVVLLAEVKQFGGQATGRYKLIRLNSDGSLDSSFGRLGVAEGRTDALGHYEAQHLTVGENSELFVFASRYNAAVITKFTPGGAIDTSYGDEGSAEIVATFPHVQDLIALADGSLLAGFSTSNGSENYKFELWHIEADGNVDTQFGASGRFSVSITDDQLYSLYGRVRVGIDGLGNIYIAGMHRTGTAQNFFVTKLDRSGIPDSNYGPSGQVHIATGQEWGTLLQSLQVASNGSAVVTGTLGYARRPIVVQIDPAGSIDRTRASDGLNVVSAVSVNEWGLGDTVALNDGSFMAGFTDLDNAIDVFRFDALGRLDVRLAGDGSTSIDPVSTSAYAEGNAIVELEGGKLLAASTELTEQPSWVYLTRYLPDGSIDRSYGTDGRLEFHADQYYGRLPSSFVSFGAERYFAVNDGSMLRIARLTADGEIDLSFGDNGWLNWELPQGDVRVYQIDSLVAVADGFLISAGGESGIFTSSYMIAKIDRNGKKVATFGNEGYILIEKKAATGTDSRLQAWADGSFAVLLSQANDRSDYETSLRRFQADGTPDTSFGNSGNVKPALSPWANGREMALRKDGRIVVFGKSLTGQTQKQFTVEQYLPDGRLDPSFGTLGAGRIEIPDVAAFQLPRGLLIDEQERIVILASIRAPEQLDTLLLRLNSNGTLDNSFGSDGAKLLSLGPFDEHVTQIAQTQAGNLILAGRRLTELESEPIFVRLREWNPPWQNSNLFEDVNADLQLSAIDALLVINHLNQSLAQASLSDVRPVDAPFVDVNGDGLCTPMDALLVINKLNSQINASGELPGSAGRANSSEAEEEIPDTAALPIWTYQDDERRRLKSS